MGQATDKIYGAVELGGTKTVAAVFSASGEIHENCVEARTPVELDPAGLVQSIAARFREAVERSGHGIEDVSGLGIGVPSTIRYDSGLIDESPNLPRVSNYPLAAELSRCLDLPVEMEKDANCYVLGEMHHGAAAGCRDCCGVTLGTGLGLGVVTGGKLLRGAGNCAGEIWQAPYRDGILEDWVSGTGLAARYARGGGEKLRGEQIHARAIEGEQPAVKAFREMGEALGFGLAYLVNILNPEVVVIGGSVADAWTCFAEPMLAVVDKYRVKSNTSRIVPGKLGRRAVLYGALSLLRD